MGHTFVWREDPLRGEDMSNINHCEAGNGNVFLSQTHSLGSGLQSLAKPPAGGKSTDLCWEAG